MCAARTLHIGTIAALLHPRAQSAACHCRTERSTATGVLNAYDNTLCQAFDRPDSEEERDVQQQQQQRWAAEQERRKMRSAKHRESGFVLHQHVNDQQIPRYDAIRDEANKFVENMQFRQVQAQPLWHSFPADR